ncbi:MAG: phosphatidylserine decarboxylase [Alkaliphilus sp.]|nr:phosphatidylserine decarboxylase [Alkaliphilus sp.]
MEIYYIDRKSGQKVREVVVGDNYLKWMYGTSIGRTALELLIKRKIFSEIYGRLQELPFSCRKINSFVDKLSLDMKEAEREKPKDYKSFNDFFARKLKAEARPVSMNDDTLISPADGRVLAFENIDKERVIQVKGFTYNLLSLFNDRELAQEYEGGTCVVVRLCPADYHRFHFPDNGLPYKHKHIKGHYYSVNPISLQRIAELYCQNKREITLFRADNFGQMLLMEVGATCVGSIIQTFDPKKSVVKGEEKGYFKFGGSTVIMFIKSGFAKIDDDILGNTHKGFETKVNMGEGIGKKNISKEYLKLIQKKG